MLSFGDDLVRRLFLAYVCFSRQFFVGLPLHLRVWMRVCVSWRPSSLSYFNFLYPDYKYARTNGKNITGEYFFLLDTMLLMLMYYYDFVLFLLNYIFVRVVLCVLIVLLSRIHLWFSFGGYWAFHVCKIINETFWIECAPKNRTVVRNEDVRNTYIGHILGERDKSFWDSSS